MRTDEDSEGEQKAEWNRLDWLQLPLVRLGVHVCTIRFFAALALKVLLLHIVLNDGVEWKRTASVRATFGWGACVCPI
jgi:hypothetical protein